MTQRHNDPFMDYVQDAFKGHEVTPPPHVYAGIRSAMGGGKPFMRVGLNSALVVLLVGAVSIASWSAYKYFDTAESKSIAAGHTPLDATLNHSQEVIIGKDALRSNADVMAEMSTNISGFEMKKSMLTSIETPKAKISNSPAANLAQGTQKSEPLPSETRTIREGSETIVVAENQESQEVEQTVHAPVDVQQKNEQTSQAILPDGWSANASTNDARDLLEQVKSDQEVIRLKLSVKVPASEEE